MSTLSGIRKLLQEKTNPNQLWFVMTYILPKNPTLEVESLTPIGYFIILEAFSNQILAQEYIEGIIERTGVKNLLAVPANKLMPISRESLGKVIPINVNKEGKLLNIAKDKDTEEEDRIAHEKEINDMIDKDQEQLRDPDSVPSIARYWYLYTKNLFTKEQLEEQLKSVNRLIEDNKVKIDSYQDNLKKKEEVIKYLENRLTTFNELPLLSLIKNQIYKEEKYTEEEYEAMRFEEEYGTDADRAMYKDISDREIPSEPVGKCDW